MPILGGEFHTCNVDFMTDLPEINGFNALMVVIDKLGKLSHLGPCRVGEGQLTAPEVAKAFFENWICFFSLPQIVIHDRDACSTASLWSIMGSHTLFSSMYHP